jgi:hypothetical protein
MTLEDTQTDPQTPPDPAATGEAAVVTQSPEEELAALRLAHASLKAQFGDGKTIPDWMQRRIDSEVARRAKAVKDLEGAQAQINALSHELVQLRGSTSLPASGAVPTGGGVEPQGSSGGGAVVQSPRLPANQQDYEAAVEAAAQRRVEEQQRLRDEEDSAQRGQAAYPDFLEKIAALRQLGDLPPHFVTIAMQTGGAEHVLYKLGSDLSLASKVKDLSLGALAVEMAKLASGPEAPPPPPRAKASSAPAPISPVGGKNPVVATDLADDKISMEEWLKRREGQRKKA